MKFIKIMQLWITVLMLSVSAYAAEEDILTVSPTDTLGIYELTISGTRDSDTATVQEYTSDIRTMNCGIYGEFIPIGCGPSVTIKALIAKGKNSGSSTYQQKFRILMEEGVYYFSFLLQGEGEDGGYKNGKVIVPSNAYNYDTVLFVSRRPSVNISLQNAAAEITGTDSFTLRNLAGETTDSQGSKQEFSAWGNFRWNPDTLSFELKDAGLQ